MCQTLQEVQSDFLLDGVPKGRKDNTSGSHDESVHHLNSIKKTNIPKTAVMCYLKSDCYVDYIFEGERGASLFFL